MSSSGKLKLALVNICFPPNAFGGATRILLDEIYSLLNHFGRDLELVVFTGDTVNANYYELTVYPYDCYRVYSVPVALTQSTNWAPVNETVNDLFRNFLEFEQPDIVHFHCIQALGAGIVEVAQQHKIPHLVTVHDAWWISDHQFLYDQHGTIYPNGHPGSKPAFTPRDGITMEQSLARLAYLKRILNSANRVLAVSDTFCTIYRNNGISNVMTNKNGISSNIRWNLKNTRSNNNVVCAYIGGIAAHKGYYLFKEAVSFREWQHIDVVTIDHAKDKSYAGVTRWGSTTVEIRGLVDQDEVNRLYAGIDVLFAPSTCVESYGLVAREAAACGCWVVASDLGGMGEDITDDNGFVISPTAAAVFKVLEEIDRNPAKYKGHSKVPAIRYTEDQTRELVGIISELVPVKAPR